MATRASAQAPTRAPRIKSEHSHQVQLVTRVRWLHPKVIIAAVPNGGKRNPIEAARLKGEGVLAGYPDLLVDEPMNGWHGCRIEMKREERGVLSAEQKDLLKRLHDKGYYVIVGYGVDDAYSKLLAYLKGEVPHRAASGGPA